MMSRTKERRLNPVVREYSRLLGLKDPGPRFSVRQHLVRICSKRPKIAAYVRPYGGKVDGNQTGRLLEYMLKNPIGDFVISDVSADKPDKLNPKIARRLRKNTKIAAAEDRKSFYQTWEWKQLRYAVLQEYGPTCMCCGAQRGDKTPQGDSVVIVVDYIKPVAKFWHLRLERTNLQILCNECNQGKGAWDQTDHRPEPGPTMMNP